jgi:hypothetical protein
MQFEVYDFYPFDKDHVYQQRYRGPTRLAGWLRMTFCAKNISTSEQ